MSTRFKNPWGATLRPTAPYATGGFFDFERVRRRRQRLMATALLTGSVAVLGSLIWHGLSEGHEPLPPDLCDASAAPPAEIAFLIDTTDPLSASQLPVVADRVRQTSADLPEGGRMTIFRLGADSAGGRPENLFSACKPSNGRDASEWTENARMLADRYRNQFADPLEAALGEIAQAQEANTSPLLEALHALSARMNRQPESPRRELVIVSDMLQNSTLMTHFRRGYSYQDLVRRSSIYLADLGGLAGARVTVYQSRERYPHLQTAEHTRFWEHYFEGAGVGELQILVL